MNNIYTYKYHFFTIFSTYTNALKWILNSIHPAFVIINFKFYEKSALYTWVARYKNNYAFLNNTRRQKMSYCSGIFNSKHMIKFFPLSVIQQFFLKKYIYRSGYFTFGLFLIAWIFLTVPNIKKI